MPLLLPVLGTAGKWILWGLAIHLGMEALGKDGPFAWLTKKISGEGEAEKILKAADQARQGNLRVAARILGAKQRITEREERQWAEEMALQGIRIGIETLPHKIGERTARRRAREGSERDLIEATAGLPAESPVQPTSTGLESPTGGARGAPPAVDSLQGRMARGRLPTGLDYVMEATVPPRETVAPR